MAVTKGAMTSLPTSQTIFVQGIEEPEHNSINFRDSLKFFQEQLVINGANFPSPSPASRTGNDTLRKNGSRSYKEQNLDTNNKISKTNDMFESEIPPVRSCKIPIPTVDTILESVRVLRAIQKSQEERGSSWNLDVTSKSNNESEYNYTDEWVKVSDINQTECLTNESNNINNGEINATNLNDKLETNGIICPESNGKGNKENTFSEINLQSNTSFTNTVNEICSFWPSNTLTNGTHTDNEYSISNLSFSIETKDMSSELSTTLCINGENIENKPFENEEIFGNSFDMKPKATLDHSDNFNQNTLLGEICTENLTNEENNIETCSTPDSLRSVCKNLLDSVHEKILDNEKCSKETALSGPESAITELKIDTYDDIDATKHEDFLLNGSLWKENCSPTESNSAKIEHNDSDSGIGTQRSASSLSANNPNHMQKDSWSDTCSSHYASAECSPYHSLNSVFESSLGLNTTQGEVKDIEYSETSAHLTSSIPENETEAFQENIKETRDEYHEISESTEQIEREVGSVQEKIQETKEAVSEEHQEISQLPKLTENELKITQEKVQEKIIEICDDPLENSESLKETNKNIDDTSSIDLTDNQFRFSDSEHEYHFENAEQDAEISYCSFISNYTIANPASIRIDEESNLTVSGNCDTSISNLEVVNGHEVDLKEKNDNVVKTESLLSVCSREEEEDDPRDSGRIQKFTANSCDLISIVESLYTITENPAYQVISPDETEEIFKESLFILSKGAFCEHPEDDYIVIIEDSTIHITKDCRELLSLNMKYGEVSYDAKNVLKIDNRLGRCIYIRCEADEIVNLKSKIEVHCLKHWKTDCLQLVHYPLKYHQNVVIVDLGSCSTRAGILMDQPTLPSLFFPTICATDKRTGTCVYGMEALQPEVRQHSNLSFPVRPSIKITKHTIDIDLLEGLFKKVFTDLKVDPTQYTVQVCLPRNLSISAQTALVKLLLEGLNVKAVSLTNQALLTLYAHDVSTAVVVDIGDRIDVLPVVDGFIVENGVTRLPHGGQRLIHHMRHGLAEKRITLSTDIDSFVVQYIIENLAYVAEDYDNELEISSRYPDIMKKTVTLQPASPENSTSKSITLEEARFKITEGLFNPDLWGLDSPGIHHLVQKAIQATSVDARKKIAENIYVSGGVTMLPGFVERLNKEVAKLSKAKIVPKVSASNYRYHCTYIGACKFAKLEVFPQVCINLEEYTQNSTAALKKCALYF